MLFIAIIYLVGLSGLAWGFAKHPGPTLLVLVGLGAIGGIGGALTP